MSESVISNKLPPIDISIPNYSYEFCPMKANVGDKLIYLSFKTRNG